MFVFSKLFPLLSFGMFNAVVVLREKKVIIFWLLSFQIAVNGASKFLSFTLQLTTAGFTLFIKKIALSSKMAVFTLRAEVMALPKIEIKWDQVSDVHDYKCAPLSAGKERESGAFYIIFGKVHQKGTLEKKTSYEILQLSADSRYLWSVALKKKRVTKFCNFRRILDIYGQWLLNVDSQQLA